MFACSLDCLMVVSVSCCVGRVVGSSFGRLVGMLVGWSACWFGWLGYVYVCLCACAHVFLRSNLCVYLIGCFV